MLEKSGQVILTDDDIHKYNKGVVSDRVQQTWGFTLEDLARIIENNNFVNVKEAGNES